MTSCFLYLVSFGWKRIFRVVIPTLHAHYYRSCRPAVRQKTSNKLQMFTSVPISLHSTSTNGGRSSQRIEDSASLCLRMDVKFVESSIYHESAENDGSSTGDNITSLSCDFSSTIDSRTAQAMKCSKYWSYFCRSMNTLSLKWSRKFMRNIASVLRVFSFLFKNSNHFLMWRPGSTTNVNRKLLGNNMDKIIYISISSVYNSIVIESLKHHK